MHTCSITILYFYLKNRSRHETDLTSFSDWQPRQDAVCHFWNFPYVYYIRTFMQAVIRNYYLLSKRSCRMKYFWHFLYKYIYRIGIVVKYIECVSSNKYR